MTLWLVAGGARGYGADSTVDRRVESPAPPPSELAPPTAAEVVARGASPASPLASPWLQPVRAAEPAPAEYLVQKGGAADDFPHTQVNSIAQTPDGYLWLATEKHGLVRFDGSQYRSFSVETLSGEPFPALDTAPVRYLYVDRRGRLLIVIGVFPKVPNSLVVYERGRFTRPDLQNLCVARVFEDLDGRLWCTGKELAGARGVFPWHGGTFDRAGQLPEFANQWPIAYAVGETTVWLAQRGLVGTLERGKFAPLPGGAGQAAAADTEGVPPTIVARPGKEAWMLAGGVFEEVPRGPNAWRHVSADGTLSDAQPFAWASGPFGYHAATADARGNLWLGSPELGLVRLSADGSRHHTYTRKDGLNDTDVRAVFEDRSGNVWVGGARGGLNLLRRPVFRAIDHRSGLRGDNVFSLAPAREGGVWIGTHSHGAYLWRDGELHLHRGSRSHSWAVLEDRRGAFWNGTYGWGLRRFSDSQEELVHSVEAGDHVYTLALFEDRSGHVWLGGAHGLSRYDPNTGTVASFRPPLFDRNAGDWVIALADDDQGALWLGTRRGYLHRFHQDRFEALWRPDPGDPPLAVCALHFLRPGELWFARFGFGLTRLRAHAFTHYTLKEGLPSKTLNGMLDDGRGFLWLTSEQGVYRIAKTAFDAFAAGNGTPAAWHRFTRKDGLPSDECQGAQNQPSLCQTPDGRLWIPTVAGIGVVDPAALPPRDPRAAPLIEEVRVFQRGSRAATLLADGQFDPAHPVTLSVPAGSSSLVIQYTGIDLANPTKVNFQYRIPQVDGTWVDARSGRTATYAALAPGAYQFELVAIDAHGARSPPATLGLRVLPLWWQTRTFQGLLMVLVAAVGPGLYVGRVRWLKRRQRQQETFARQLIQREEDQRKRVAQEVHDGLGHELVLLKNTALEGLRHVEPGAPLHDRLEHVSALASRALQQTRLIAHRLRPVELDRLGLVQALESLLNTTAARAGLRLFKDLDDLGDRVPSEMQVHLYRLVQEALQNVLKHARASTVMIEVKQEADTLRIQLTDDGVGFDPATVTSHRTGLGLTGMEERVRLLGGTLALASAPGQGTRLQASLPLPPP